MRGKIQAYRALLLALGTISALAREQQLRKAVDRMFEGFPPRPGARER